MSLGPGQQKLWGWFGLSYASFLTLPRVLMHEMPDEWQSKMADLLHEYEDEFCNMGDVPRARVLAVRDKKLTKWPAWLLNYRRPDMGEIEAVRSMPNRHAVSPGPADRRKE